MAEFLSGKYTHQLDDRGRLRIPPKLKEILGEKPFVTLGSGKCLVVYSNENAQAIFAERFKNVDGLSPDPQLDRMREVFSNGAFVDEDKQGRITIPQYLIDDCGFAKNIVSIGMFNRIEIWGEEEWESIRKAKQSS